VAIDHNGHEMNVRCRCTTRRTVAHIDTLRITHTNKKRFLHFAKLRFDLGVRAFSGQLPFRPIIGIVVNNTPDFGHEQGCRALLNWHPFNTRDWNTLRGVVFHPPSHTPRDIVEKNQSSAVPFLWYKPPLHLLDCFPLRHTS
jgi:hypothetical protein